MKMAKIKIYMECGGEVVTYLKCRDEKQLAKKLKKRQKDGWFDFGHFRVNDAAVIYASYTMENIH